MARWRKRMLVRAFHLRRAPAPTLSGEVLLVIRMPNEATLVRLRSAAKHAKRVLFREVRFTSGGAPEAHQDSLVGAAMVYIAISAPARKVRAGRRGFHWSNRSLRMCELSPETELRKRNLCGRDLGRQSAGTGDREPPDRLREPQIRS